MVDMGSSASLLAQAEMHETQKSGTSGPTGICKCPGTSACLERARDMTAVL